MNKKLILVAAPPASGKNYASELICRAVGDVAYFDKDDLGILLRRAFSLCGERPDMDGEFYLENLRPVEYEALLKQAFSALRFSSAVLVNAPFLREVRDAEYMRGLKERAHTFGAELILVWVTASDGTRFERMRARNSDRDTEKLTRWNEYLRQTDNTVPQMLGEQRAVDILFVFDNENEEVAMASLKKFLNLL